MMFSGGIGVVARRAKHLAQRHTVSEIGRICVRKSIVTTARRASLVCMDTGQQTGTRRETFGGIVELPEAHTVIGQRIKIGRLNLRPIAPDIGPAHIIDHNQHNIGTGRRTGHPRQKQACQQYFDD